MTKEDTNGIPVVVKEQYAPRIIELIFYVTSAIMFTVFIVLYVWSREQAPIIIYETKVHTPTVKVGGKLKYSAIVQFRDLCDMQMERRFIGSDDVIRSIEAAVWHPTKLGAERFTVEIDVPMVLPLGPVRYEATLYYECNPYQVWYPQSTVIPPIDFILETNEELIYEEEDLTEFEQ